METTLSPPRAHDALAGFFLPSLLEQQALSRPDAIAVESERERLTYRDLHGLSARLADDLRDAGVAPDDCVGLFADPSPDLVVGVWGILSAGGAYLPLSPEYPEERLRYMLADCGAQVVVAQEHLAARLTELAPPGIRVITPNSTGSGAVGGGVPPRPEGLAYVIYTSGSTGRPKGVLIEHRSIASQMRWLHAFGHLGAEASVLQKTPMSFDAAQWEILAPAFGARVVLGAPGIHRDPDALIDAINAHQVTTLQCVPTLLQALLDTERFGTCTSLRRVFSGGEALSRPLARQVTDELPWVSLINLYGPTECTINATAHLVDPAEIGDGTGAVPIGVPVDNTQCFILDENGSPADIGETGELHVGGVQLARGYLGRPEQTAEKFVPSPFVPTERLYRTGDLAHWNPDGSIQFCGRADNQVKLRGHRVELDEIALGIAEHAWVRQAAAIVTDDPRTGFQNLIACVELNPREATVMDQGNEGAHHRSKSNKLQVKAQLSNPGVRGPEELRGRPVVALPGKQETAHQRRETFARKTYRFYEGGEVTRADVEALLGTSPRPERSRGLDEPGLAEWGEILRWFGQFHSPERLLPKYSYASPGALYATQLHVEITGLDAVDPGVYYYHPVDHVLVRVAERSETREPTFRLHFAGRTSAIEPVYANNVREVLEFETGHMLGVLEEVLPGHGLDVRAGGHQPSIMDEIGAADSDHYLGTFEIRPNDGTRRPNATELYVQAHPGRVDGLPAGQYRWTGAELLRISDELVQARHVIAINQAVHDRSSFGITAVSRAEDDRLEYVDLGATLHRLQRNDLGLGFMSSGYSSKTGHPLAAARRVDEILASCGIEPGASYFFLGGKTSERQRRSEGMHEDAVHMRGPAEIVKDDLARLLPEYMLPNRVLVLDRLPLTANGKVDTRALAESSEVREAEAAPYVAPATDVERRLAGLWGEALKYEDVSTRDEFFAAGGNSLIAVTLVNRINREFGTELPLQVLFEHPELAELATRIADDSPVESSRLVRLHDGGNDRPVHCWPGLGGYPMNLRALARESGLGGPFYGVQAHGINAGEDPYETISGMAAADLAEIRREQPTGPYRLWGYSFGARVAFEAAWQLEQQGEQVEHLMLICPGNPEIAGATSGAREASYSDTTYLTILFSVFAGTISGPDLDRCLAEVEGEDDFVAFVHERYPSLDEDVIRRITRIVERTYEFDYTFHELAERSVSAPVTLFKAVGDDYSFIEGSTGYSAEPPGVVELGGDHYAVLGEQGVAELAAALRAAHARQR
ncbi:amino acid adenylation domain-containing protein [Saccharopolyspora sp. ID03-671]|uniref:non-ribosomal peptide synthetase family protein n=1 Tax=Saccharopolyspora sp. ID03-671 TaxID=3073066 RepID=UPI00325562ED